MKQKITTIVRTFTYFAPQNLGTDLIYSGGWLGSSKWKGLASHVQATVKGEVA